MTVRPMVRQTFKLEELLDMILSVAGKDAARVRQLLHSGTVVYHFFRYSWAGFDADENELAAALAQFPDAEPLRPFAPKKCTNAVFDGPGANPRHLLDLDMKTGSKRRNFSAARVSGSACWKSPWKRILRTTNIPTRGGQTSIVLISTRKICC